MKVKEKAKLYTVFLHSYSSKKDKLLEKLRSEINDVEFIGVDKLSGISGEKGREAIYQSIRNMKNNLDGILVFGGFLDEGLTSLGLPVIMVRSLLGVYDWEKGILKFYKGKKLLTTSLSDFDKTPEAESYRFKDLIGKIRLIAALKKVKDSKLLIIQEPEILGSYDLSEMDYHYPIPSDYNKVYSKRLKETGPEVVHASMIELNKAIEKVDKTEAVKIADIWMNEAIEVRKTNRGEVLKAAKMYLGIKELIKKYNADGVAVRSLIPWTKRLINVTPCLANTELNKQNITAVCEGLVNSAITEMIGIYTTGNPSFIGDVVGIDRFNNAVTFAHCQCPVNPHGNDRIPYILRDHALQKANDMLPADYPESAASLSAAIQVVFPMNEAVTSVKLNLYNKRMGVSTGISASGYDFYKKFDDILCRTKLVMKTDTEAFEKNFDTISLGVHRNLIFGDHRQTFKDLSALIGYEVVEEDR